MKLGKKVCFGTNVGFGRNADVRPPSRFVTGDRVWFGKNFTCETDVFLGSDVLVSSNVSIVGKDHPFTDPEITIFNAPRSDHTQVHVGSNVLIGFGTVVVGSLRIGDGCIIGAGSVVVKDLPSNMICVGNPAKPLRPRYADLPTHTVTA